MPILPYHCTACGADFEIWRRDPDEVGAVECAECESAEVEAKPREARKPRGGFVQILGTVHAKDGDEAARKIREGDMLERTEDEALADLDAALGRGEVTPNDGGDGEDRGDGGDGH